MLQACVLVFLAACASSEDGGTTQLPPGYYSSGSAVCSLVKGTDLEATQGYHYRNGVSEFNPDFLTLAGVSTCSFSRAEPGAYPKLYLGVVYAYADEIFSGYRKSGGVVQVKGVGQSAVWAPNSTQMFVLAKGKMLVIQTVPDLSEKSSDLIERVSRLARLAIDRLQ